MEIDLSADPAAMLKAFEAEELGQQATPSGAAAPDKEAEARAAQEAAEAAAAAAAAKAAEEAAAAAKAAEAAKVDTQQVNKESNAEGVLARDGKNVIPFSVLKSERDRAARAEQLAKEAAEQVEALKAQLAAGNQGAKTGEGARTTEAATEAVAMTPEELEAFKEDFPTQYKVYMAQQATIKALTEKQQQADQDRQQQEQQQQRTHAEQVRDAIDATPKLAHIKASDPERFEAALRYDNALRADPKWDGKSLAERFAEVVKLVETTHGAIEIPGATPVTAQKTPEQLKQEAEALAAASAKKVVPTSMSDFPAGHPPATNEQQALESMTTLQLAEKLGKMSSEQLETYLSNL